MGENQDSNERGEMSRMRGRAAGPRRGGADEGLASVLGIIWRTGRLHPGARARFPASVRRRRLSGAARRPRRERNHDRVFAHRAVPGERARMALAREKVAWPRFELPRESAPVTARDVLNAEPGDERDAALKQWCAAVWESWRHAHAWTRRFCEERLAGSLSRRVRSR